MPVTLKKILRLRYAAALALTAAMVAACGGGSSDTAGSGCAKGETQLTLVAYSVPQPGWDKLTPAFKATQEGKGVCVVSSYGASGDQANKVKDGLNADLVNLSLEPDITKLVKAGKVSADWNKNNTHGIPFTSVVVFVVKKGNPKNLEDWADLLQPGLEVVTPSPLSSGSAKWNLLAPYAAKSNGGQDQQAGLAFIEQLVKGHVKTHPASGRDASEAFTQGTGDVLLSYENEALNLQRQGKDVDIVIPYQSFKIENPLAVTSSTAHPKEAKAFNDFQYTHQAQKLWAEAGFRPVDPGVAQEFATKFQPPRDKLWTIADLGGWSAVDSALFDKENGKITVIYKQATG
jgi:sulfate transport system substrate-binding protein